MVRNAVNNIRWLLAAMDPNLEESFTSRQSVTNMPGNVPCEQPRTGH